MGHVHCHHHHRGRQNASRLLIAILINTFLSAVQLLAGFLTGSLALVADSIHNLSDVGSLLIAYLAQRLSLKKPNDKMPYGYGRAEVVGALVNSVLIIGTSAFLIFEAYERAMSIKPIEGFWVIIVGILALVVDSVTAYITHKGAQDSVNMKAAFLHNLFDAFASIVVIVSGFSAMFFNIYWIDAVATIGISVFIFAHAYPLLISCMKTIMQSAPGRFEIAKLKDKVVSISHVKEVSEARVWVLNDDKFICELKIATNLEDLNEIYKLKSLIRDTLKNEFEIFHSTIEFSNSNTKTQSS